MMATGTVELDAAVAAAAVVAPVGSDDGLECKPGGPATGIEAVTPEEEPDLDAAAAFRNAMRSVAGGAAAALPPLIVTTLHAREPAAVRCVQVNPKSPLFHK